MSQVTSDTTKVTIENMYSDSEYKFSEKELAQLEKLYDMYDKMLEEEAKKNPPQVGYCGFKCNFGCPKCMDSGYDHNDEL